MGFRVSVLRALLRPSSTCGTVVVAIPAAVLWSKCGTVVVAIPAAECYEVTMSETDNDEEAVLRKYAKNLQKGQESWTGCIEGDDNLQALLHDLLTIGVSFKTTSSKYKQGNSKEGPGKFLCDTALPRKASDAQLEEFIKQ